jgi:thioredoxin 1
MAEGITDFDDNTFDEHVNGADLPVIVDFWAEWCGPCRMVAPILEQIASENEGKLVVGKLNVDDNPNIARRYEIMSIPTILIFKEGVLKKRLIGAKGKGQLMEELAEFV